MGVLAGQAWARSRSGLQNVEQEASKLFLLMGWKRLIYVMDKLLEVAFELTSIGLGLLSLELLVHAVLLRANLILDPGFVLFSQFARFLNKFLLKFGDFFHRFGLIGSKRRGFGSSLALSRFFGDSRLRSELFLLCKGTCHFFLPLNL